MIDVDKVKAAFAATGTLCQGTFYKAPSGVSPAALCAVSALTAYAGMHPDLIGKFCTSQKSFERFSWPILEVEYGIPLSVAQQIPLLFDNEENEWRGVSAVIKMCEEYNVEAAKSTPYNSMYSLADFGVIYHSYFTQWKNSIVWGGSQKQAKAEKFDWNLSLDGTPGIVDKPVSGETLKLAAGFLGTSHIEHPSEGTISKILYADDPKALVTSLVSPAEQIIAPAYDLKYVATVRPQKQLVGAMNEWKVT